MPIDEREDEFTAIVDNDAFDPPEEFWGTEGEVPTLEPDLEFVDDDLIIK